MSDDASDSFETIDALFIVACILTLVCMRGCWHAGRIADKLTPESGDGFSQQGAEQ